jgi:transposase
MGESNFVAIETGVYERCDAWLATWYRPVQHWKSAAIWWKPWTWLRGKWETETVASCSERMPWPGWIGYERISV